MRCIETIITDDVITMSTRLIVAALLTGIIGLERQFHQHQAGLRTYILVGVGSCLFMLISIFGFQEYLYENKEVVSYNVSQISSYVITGISFLTGGLILKEGASKVKGLTTASSIWVCAGIGLSVGVGMYTVAVITSIIVLASLHLLNKVGVVPTSKEKTIILKVEACSHKGSLLALSSLLEEKGLAIKNISMEKVKGECVLYNLTVNYPSNLSLTKIYDEIFRLDYVYKVY